MGKVKKGAGVVTRLLVLMSMVRCFGIPPTPTPPLPVKVVLPQQKVSLETQQQMVRAGQTSKTTIGLKDQSKSSITNETMLPHTFSPGATQSPGDLPKERDRKQGLIKQAGITPDALNVGKTLLKQTSFASTTKTPIVSSPKPIQMDSFFKSKPTVTPEPTIVQKKQFNVTTQDATAQPQLFQSIKTPAPKQIQDAVVGMPQPSRANVITQVPEILPFRPTTQSVSKTKVETIIPSSPQVLKLQEATRPSQSQTIKTLEEINKKPVSTVTTLQEIQPIFQEKAPVVVDQKVVSLQEVTRRSQPQTTIKTLKEIEPKLAPVLPPSPPMKKPAAFSGWNEGYAVPIQEEVQKKALIKQTGIIEQALVLQKASLKPVQKFDMPEEKVTPPPLPPRPKKDVDPKKIVEASVAAETKKIIDQKAADKKKKIAAGVAIGAGVAAIAGLAVGLGVGLSQDDKQPALVPVPVVPIPTPSEDISSPFIVPVGAPVVEPTTTPSRVPVSTPSVVVPVVVVDKKEEGKNEEKKEEPKPEPVKEAGLIPPPVVEKEIEEPMPEPVQKFEVLEVIHEEKIVEKPVLEKEPEREPEEVPVIEPVKEPVIEKEIESPEPPRVVPVVAKKKKLAKKKVAVAQPVPEPKKPKRKAPSRKKYVAGRKQEEKRPVKKVARPKPKPKPVAKAPARKSGEKSRLGKNPIIGSQMKITPVN